MSTLRLEKQADGDWSFEFPSLVTEFNDSLDSISDAWFYDNAEPNKILNDLTNIIKICPDHIDAYCLLGLVYEECGCEDLAFRILEVGIQRVLRILPKEFDFRKHKISYYDLDNRPFFRLYHAWGLAHLKAAKDKRLKFLSIQNLEIASEIFLNLISIHYNDNICASDLLIECYLKLGRYEDVLSICKLYQNEFEDEAAFHDKETTAPSILYGRVLGAIQLNRSDVVQKWLKVAIERKPLIAEILALKNPSQPENYNPNILTSGGADEAYNYWYDYHDVWFQCNAAMVLLRKKTTRKLIEEAKHRCRPFWEVQT
jgi:hypothetical protein